MNFYFQLEDRNNDASLLFIFSASYLHFLLSIFPKNQVFFFPGLQKGFMFLS